jgi:DNA polymerase-1
MIKLAMIRIQEEFEAAGLHSRMIMQVHDELVFEVHGDERNIVERAVKEHMEKALELSVPVVVETGWGQNWEEAH